MPDNVPMRYGRPGSPAAGGAPVFEIQATQLDAQTIAANGNLIGVVDVTWIGRRPIALAGFSTGASACSVARVNLDGTTLHYNIRNLTGSAITTTPIFRILYVRTR